MMSPKFDPVMEKILHRFIKDYFASSGASGLIIGLSGGLDSTVVLKLSADAIGAEKIKGLLLPDKSTPKVNMEQVREYCAGLGVDIEEIDITSHVEALLNLHPSDSRMIEGNVKARARMIHLFHYAGMESRLVVGTSNKSELLTGYFTKYGDGAADISPIGDLYKTQVRELAGQIGVPSHFIDKKPSGDLWHGQTDEDELGITYETLDRILHGIELGLDDDTIVQRTGLGLDEVQHVRKLVERSIHKRRLGLIPKLGLRTIGLDWREA